MEFGHPVAEEAAIEPVFYQLFFVSFTRSVRCVEMRISAGHAVFEVYYITTFGSGRTSPTRFHRNGDLQRRMYLPTSPLDFPGYISLRSSPLVLGGSVNFARPDCREPV